MSNNFIQSKNPVKIVLCIFLLMVIVQGVQAAETYSFVTKWGTYGSEEGQFSYPEGVAIDSSGNVYVVDRDNSRIQKFSSDGGFLGQWGALGTGDGQFDQPNGIAVDLSGNIYVADTNNQRIQKFSSEGAFLAMWGTWGTGDGQFMVPIDVAVDSAGNVYVAEHNNNRIQKFSSDGAFLGKWGSSGSGNGQFNSPRGVAVDSLGYVYVADWDNLGIGLCNRIQKFSSDGAFLGKWGSYGTGDGQFANPTRVATDSAGNVYVADLNNNRIQKFSSDGAFLGKWGTAGNENGQFNAPDGVAVDSLGYVYVVDYNNHRIQKFMPSSKVPTITSISPASGTINGGTLVTITGSGFTGAFEVTFGGTPATGLTIISDTQITVTAPPSTSIGAVTVTIFTTGGIITKQNAYTYTAPPITYFVGIPTSGTAPLTVQFIDNSTNSPTTWDWDFGDGSTSTLQFPPHTYTNPGTYTVALTATNSAGSNTITQTNYITVINMNQNPVAEAGTPQTVIVKEPATFDGSKSKDPDGSITSYTWNFGDGSSGSGVLQTHPYATSGTFIVTLKVADDKGAEGTDTTTVTVKSSIQAIQDVITEIKLMNLPKGTENSLTSKLENAIKSLEKGNTNAAKNQLEATINEINAQKGKNISEEQANILISDLQEIIQYL